MQKDRSASWRDSKGTFPIAQWFWIKSFLKRNEKSIFSNVRWTQPKCLVQICPNIRLGRYGFSAQLPIQAKTRGRGWIAGSVKANCTNNIYSSDPTDLFCALFRGNRLGEALSAEEKQNKLPKMICLFSHSKRPSRKRQSWKLPLLLAMNAQQAVPGPCAPNTMGGKAFNAGSIMDAFLQLQFPTCYLMMKGKLCSTFFSMGQAGKLNRHSQVSIIAVEF